METSYSNKNPKTYASAGASKIKLFHLNMAQADIKTPHWHTHHTSVSSDAAPSTARPYSTHIFPGVNIISLLSVYLVRYF